MKDVEKMIRILEIDSQHSDLGVYANQGCGLLT